MTEITQYVMADIKQGVFERDVPGVEKSWYCCNQLQQPLARKDGKTCSLI